MKLTLLVSTLAASLCAGEVLVSLPVNVDGNLKNLQLLRGETFERAALSFMELNGLVADGVESQRSQDVIAQLASMLREKVTEQQPAPPKEIVVTVPLTIDGVESSLTLFRDEPISDAVSRFLRDSALTEEFKLEAAPQLLQVLANKVAELNAPAQEPQFSFDISIDGQSAVVQHFQGADPLVEAREFAARVGVTDETFLGQLLPTVAKEIQKRIDELTQPQTTPSQTELFSVPLTVNNQAVVLVHYEGWTPTQSALSFLNQNGITDPNTVNEYLPQLIEVLDNQVRQLADAQAAAVPQQATAAAPTRSPLLSVPITIGDQVHQLTYYQGDSLDLTAQLFLEAHGLTNNPNYAAFVTELSLTLRKGIQELDQQMAVNTSPKEPLFQLPITLGGATYDLAYYDHENPGAVATEFCTSKIPALTASFGRAVTDDEVQQCKVYIFQTITRVVDELAAQSVQSPVQVPVEKAPLLFTLDIDLGEGRNAALPFHDGDNAVDVANQFCERNNVDVENVPMLVEEIRKQVAKV
ncbi:hypothetical protein DYB34_005895 [Aphanomyces astaci]|uniref:PFU domain-containing protein n=1 Tax=Aphanomyces astaci TaxID=112090 RepID=A0A418BHQ1_APHAT|nr:hypothetical protein DYB34_005895 [Aphanomyces astaci]